MSWKTGGRPWPLAVRLTAWYSTAVLALLAAAVAALHVSIERDADRAAEENIGPALAKLHASRDVILGLPGIDTDDAALRVVAPDGRTVHEAPLLAGALPPAAFPPPGGRADTVAADGRAFVLFTREFDGWRYQVALSRADERKFLVRVYRNVGLVTLPVLVAAVLAGFLIARAGLRPLRRVAAEVQAVSAERLDRRVETQGVPRELAQVADSFNRTMDRLGAAVARLDQFAADVAHELRTPVHNLRTAAELALRAPRSADEYRRALAGVTDGADRLARLIDRLLLLARLADPRCGMSWEAVDVGAELVAVREFFEPAASDAGVAVAVDAPTALSHPLDRSLFQRALSNLVTNALSHTPAGGRIGLRARTGPAGLVVEVTDTGTGISADAVPHLFDRYYRPVRSAGGGLGLGLAIVKRVAELHGGAAVVSSAVGVGTTVRLTLPGTVRQHDTPVTNLTRG